MVLHTTIKYRNFAPKSNYLFSMKQFFFLVVTFIVALNSNAQITESATDAVKNMGVGWNLGNTLDANIQSVADVNNVAFWGCQGLESETCWGQPNTSSALMKMMKDAGFDAIRVPVTWYNHMDKDGKVYSEWMSRVKTVVDYVIDNGMYCIINVHHDTGADETGHVSWIKADENNYYNNKSRFEYLWKQIAEEFKNYDQHLLFEAYNEMLDIQNSWCFASFNCSGQYDSQIANSAYNGINSYAQSFVNTVRATGGNNSTRNLIVNTYAAANGYGSWNSHLSDVLTKMIIPQDKVEGHIILEVHDYPNITDHSIAEVKSQIDNTISTLNTHIISKGIPVILGEFGTTNVNAGTGGTDYDLRRDKMLQFVEYYVRQCKAHNIATFYWMGLSDRTYRSIPAFNQADLAEKLVKAYHGDDFESTITDINNNYSEDLSNGIVFIGDRYVSNWNIHTKIPNTLFQEMGPSVKLELTYKQEGGADDIQLYYGDWSNRTSFIVDGNTFNGDLYPEKYYGTPSGTEHTTIITFDNSVYNELVNKGLIVFGDGYRLYKVKLFSSTTNIKSINMKQSCKDCFLISGIKIKESSHKIYIEDGKKIYK